MNFGGNFGEDVGVFIYIFFLIRTAMAMAMVTLPITSRHDSVDSRRLLVGKLEMLRRRLSGMPLASFSVVCWALVFS